MVAEVLQDLLRHSLSTMALCFTLTVIFGIDASSQLRSAPEDSTYIFLYTVTHRILVPLITSIL